MTTKELRDLTTADLKAKLEQEGDAYNKLKLNHAVSSLENPMLLRSKRRGIARIKTELRSRERNQNNG